MTRSQREWIDGPERLTTGAGQEANLAVSADGTRLVFTATSSRTRLWEFPFDAAAGHISGQPSPITRGSTGEVDFDVRADGSKIAYQTVRAGRNELWERSTVAGEERLLLSSTDSRLAKPLWSPDGAKLAFLRCAPRGNSLAVAVLNTDGTGDRVLSLPRDVQMIGSDWAKDGQAILGACRFNGSGRYSTCMVPLSIVNERGDSPVQVIASDSRRNLYNQRFSPDQRWITFLAHDLLHASTSTVYVIPAAGGPWRAMTEGTWFDDKPRWSPDGRILYFVSNRTGVANIWGRRFNTSSRHADWRAIPGHVLPVRAVRLDAADGPDGHRDHAHETPPADERVAQRPLDAGSDRSLNLVRRNAPATITPNHAADVLATSHSHSHALAAPQWRRFNSFQVFSSPSL